jgi:hypothetical protein
MSRLDRTTNGCSRTLAIVIAAITLVAIAGPSSAVAAEAPPPRPETPPVVGPVTDAGGGFIYRNGRYTPLDTVDGLVTVHLAINNREQTAGAYFRSLDPFDPGGFVRDRKGRYTRSDVAPGPSALVFDFNDRGTTVGQYGDVATLEGGSFLREANGEVTTVEVPGASSADAVGINNRGAVVGSTSMPTASATPT